MLRCERGTGGEEGGGEDLGPSSKSELELPRKSVVDRPGVLWLSSLPVKDKLSSNSSKTFSARPFRCRARGVVVLELSSCLEADFKAGFCGEDSVSTGRKGARCFRELLFIALAFVYSDMTLLIPWS